jgi:hypothetical protein
VRKGLKVFCESGTGGFFEKVTEALFENDTEGVL